MDFSNRLHQLRKEKGLTQQQLADLIGKSKTAISNYESGRIEPSIEELIKLSKVLNCSLDYLIIGTENAKKSTPQFEEGLNDEEKSEIKLALAEVKGYLKGIFRGKENLYYKFEQHLPKSSADSRTQLASYFFYQNMLIRIQPVPYKA